RAQYKSTKNVSETAMPRTTNIIPAPSFSIHGACVRRSTVIHRATVHHACSALQPDKKAAGTTCHSNQAVAGYLPLRRRGGVHPGSGAACNGRRGPLQRD